ncbi:MAG: STM4015 family protein [Pirellulales bacterium]|nr:STM4015 family protein [Pirellulales bacterium]
MTFSNAEQFAGKRVVDFQRDTPLSGLDSTAYRLRIEYDDEHTMLDLLTALLEDAAVDRLEALVIGAWQVDESDRPSTEVVEALVAAASQLASMRSLFLGDIASEENEVSWIVQSDVSPLWTAFPRLETFQVRGGYGLALGPLKHDHLKSLVIECGGLPRSVLQEMAAAKLPALEHLELYLGTGGYGWDGSIDDVRPLLQPGLFPRLKYLGLRDSEIADEVANAVAESPILKQIEVLDLSLGTLGDDGGRALLACQDLQRLKRLDLSHHYLSNDLVKQFDRLPIEVDLDDPQEEDRYGRYVAVGE